MPEYFSDLITNVCLFSYTLGPQSSLKPPKLVTQRECIVLMNEFIATWKSNTSDNAIFQEKAKTFLYPTLQMRSLNITQDETLLTNLFKSATFGDIIHIATSYFNLPVKYQNILWKSKARFEILTSAPEANGFFNSDGVSKYIPPAYSYLETKFLNRAYVAGKGKSVIVHEYSKPGWTWHGKGIWWQKKDGILITAIGSSNMNYRSLDRDLELQFYLQTSDSELKRRFHKNLSNLYHHTNIITLQALKKRKSSWILKLAAEAVKRFL